jgi:hypothetical protein
MKRKALTFPSFYGKTLNLDLITATIGRLVAANTDRCTAAGQTTSEA